MTANQPPPSRPDGDARRELINFISSQSQSDIHPELRDSILTMVVALPTTSPARDAAEGRVRYVASTCFLERSEVRQILIGQPDENLHITEAVLEEIDALPIFNADDSAPPKPAPDAVREALDDRQRVVIEWGERCFGSDHMRDKIVRAARFFEEAAELVQAVGLPRDHAMRAFNHVYSREAGEPAQEAGGAANTLMALCGALDLSFDGCQQVEIARCLSKDPSHFAGRNEAKLREVDAIAAPVPPTDGALWKTVPLEPTLEMQKAGYEALKLFFPDAGSPIGHYRIYEAMLAVAPPATGAAMLAQSP